MLRRTRIWLITTVVVLAIGGVVAFQIHKKRHAGTEVRLEQVSRRDLVASVTASGKIEAKTSVDISADITGRIIDIAVREGDLVKRGQFLLQIDPAQYQAAVARAQGVVSSTEATLLQTRTIGGVTVLTDDEGYTLYWFGPDSATKSACLDSCARSWPPVTGPATWDSGVTGTIGAIVRPGGALQATYNGHPLYTTTADTSPGQTKGNGVWSHGGEWHEVTVPSQAD